MKDERLIQDKWIECIKKIPQIDAYQLDGIKNWHISQFEMVPGYDTNIHDKLFREEAYKLMASGFDLGFNTDNGVGHIRIVEDGFVIELWQNGEKKDIHKKTFDEVLDWIIYFYDNYCMNKKEIKKL